MDREQALTYMNKRYNEGNSFGMEDVDFIVDYIKHITGKVVTVQQVTDAIQNRTNPHLIRKIGDTFSSHINSMFYHVVKEFNLSIKEIANFNTKF